MRNGFGGSPTSQTHIPSFRCSVFSFDCGIGQYIELGLGSFPGAAPYFFQCSLTHGHRDKQCENLKKDSGILTLLEVWYFGTSLLSLSSPFIFGWGRQEPRALHWGGVSQGKG